MFIAYTVCLTFPISLESNKVSVTVGCVAMKQLTLESLSSSGRIVLCVILSKDMVGEHLEWQLETATLRLFCG